MKRLPITLILIVFSSLKLSAQLQQLSGSGIKSSYMVQGVIAKVEMQGLYNFKVTVLGDSNKLFLLWCSTNEVKFDWPKLKKGKKVGANGKWFGMRGEEYLEVQTLKILN